MPYASFDGIEIIKALRRRKFRPESHVGSHIKLRFENPDDEDDVRIVTVPLTDADNISQGTYRSIANQCVHEDTDADFEKWINWIENS